MELLPKDFCIFIASHISKSTRIPYLRECLDSLFRQQIRIQIYLSISFENHNIQIECMHHLESFIANAQCNLLNISIRNIKTPQMQHLYLLHNEFGQKHTWIMFCDDDDSYTVDRTNYIISAVSIGQANLPNKRVAGVYENVAGTHHTIARQEYWCYCINIQLLTRFFEIVAPDSRLLNNTCCDVLLGEYLRRLSPTWSFAILTKPCYQYRIHNNADSITGAIQSKHGDYHPQSSCPPEPDSPEWAKYVIDWNDFYTIISACIFTTRI